MKKYEFLEEFLDHKSVPVKVQFYDLFDNESTLRGSSQPFFTSGCKNFLLETYSNENLLFITFGENIKLMWLSFRADCQNIRKTQKDIESILKNTPKSYTISNEW